MSPNTRPSGLNTSRAMTTARDASYRWLPWQLSVTSVVLLPVRQMVFDVIGDLLADRG
jgi:hypothetical protein